MFGAPVFVQRDESSLRIGPRHDPTAFVHDDQLHGVTRRPGPDRLRAEPVDLGEASAAAACSLSGAGH